MNYNQSQVLISLCLWEELLENEYDYPGYARYRADNGVCECRDMVTKLVKPAEHIWEAALSNGFLGLFDWDFVPLFLKHCTNCSEPLGDSMECTVEPSEYDLAGKIIVDIMRKRNWKGVEQ